MKMAWRTYPDMGQPETRSERELVESAMAGDTEAFSALASASARRLYAVARLILHNDALAEEATQEALVVAWRDLSALRDPNRFGAWLHRVLVRECYKHAYRERRRIEVEGQVRPLAGDFDPSRQSIVSEQIERGFARLSVEQRTVLILHHYLGYSFPEMADALGIPVGTVKSKVSRACAAMRKALTAEREPGPLKEGQVA
jgi:RNA polymerase sigma-70 factor (ECF subfamily)